MQCPSIRVYAAGLSHVEASHAEASHAEVVGQQGDVEVEVEVEVEGYGEQVAAVLLVVSFLLRKFLNSFYKPSGDDVSQLKR